MARGKGVGRTRYEWQGAAGAEAALAAAGVIVFLIGLADKAETVMRVRGRIAVLGEGIAAGEATLVTWGVRVFAPGSVAGNVTTSPFTNSEDDWLAYGMIPLVGGTVESVALSVEVDSKAMRRMREGEELALVFENTTLVGAGDAVRVAFGLRVLTGE